MSGDIESNLYEVCSAEKSGENNDMEHENEDAQNIRLMRLNEDSSLSSAGRVCVRISKIPFNLVVAAFLLFFGGIALLTTGCSSLLSTTKEQQGLDILITGAVMIIPGSYGMVLILGTMLNWRGYEDVSSGLA